MSSENNLVSIITPLYNSEPYIGQMIESIIGQTYPHWELLITDDCSTDGSCSIVERYAKLDERIKLFRLPQNTGAGIARNESISRARGRYIAFCDSDDWWCPEKLETQLDFMRKNRVQLCYSSYYTCNEEGEVDGVVVSYKSIPYSHIIRDDSIGFLTCIYDTHDVGKCYLPSIRRRQDWALKIKLLKKCGRAYGIVKPLAYYRVREGSLSRNKFRLVKYNIQVYREILNYGIIRAWLVFVFLFFPNYLLKRLRLSIINM